MEYGSRTTVWVPCDAAAVSVGADEVAAAFAAAGATVRRNGSRGMLWLEPLVEVEQPAPEGASQRIGYANVAPDDTSAVLDGSAESIGVVENHEWLTRQRRVT
ncbi:MAG: formate dehydrogenase, partial [Intrasporangiaceae bacterium]|nr:formate dehydrogenase [Intrasporangiaceae bacterium]